MSKAQLANLRRRLIQVSNVTWSPSSALDNIYMYGFGSDHLSGDLCRNWEKGRAAHVIAITVTGVMLPARTDSHADGSCSSSISCNKRRCEWRPLPKNITRVATSSKITAISAQCDLESKCMQGPQEIAFQGPWRTSRKVTYMLIDAHVLAYNDACSSVPRESQ